MFSYPPTSTELGAGFDLKSLTSAAGGASGISTSLQSAIPAAPVRNALRSSPVYLQNRDRAAYMIEKGLTLYDVYVTTQPFLFYGSLLNAAFSSYMLYKRRGKGSEAMALYSLNLLVSLAVAWFTRPGQIPAAPPGTPPAQAQAFQILGALDQAVAARRGSDPNFADTVFTRIVNMPGIKEEMDKNPLVKAAVV